MAVFLYKSLYYCKNRINSFLDWFSATVAIDLELVLADQELQYAAFGLNRQTGISRLNEGLYSLSLGKYDELNGMYSEHMILFSALSVKHPTSGVSILEIGTWNANFTKILSGLFP
jgi:hypothetical protein